MLSAPRRGSGSSTKLRRHLAADARADRATRRRCTGMSARVCAPRDSSRAERGGDDRARDAQQVDHLVGRDLARGQVLGERRRGRPASRPPRFRLCASRTTPQSALIVRCTAPRSASGARHVLLAQHDRIGRHLDRRPARATSTPAIAPVDSGPTLPATIACTTRCAEHQAVEQRVGREPVRAVHAAARGLAARPQVRQRRRAVEVGDHTAGEVVRGRRDRQPVARGIEAGRPARLPDRREAAAGSRRSSSRRATGARRWSRPSSGGSRGPRRRAARGRRAGARRP